MANNRSNLSSRFWVPTQWLPNQVYQQNHLGTIFFFHFLLKHRFPIFISRMEYCSLNPPFPSLPLPFFSFSLRWGRKLPFSELLFWLMECSYYHCTWNICSCWLALNVHFLFSKILKYTTSTAVCKQLSDHCNLLHYILF